MTTNAITHRVIALVVRGSIENHIPRIPNYTSVYTNSQLDKPLQKRHDICLAVCLLAQLQLYYEFQPSLLCNNPNN